MADLQVTLKIYGRVQGVSFRAAAREKAAEMRLRGWVRNERDGSVLVVAQGLIKVLQDFIEWCDHGPPGAGVESMDIEFGEIEPGAELKDFEIR